MSFDIRMSNPILTDLYDPSEPGDTYFSSSFGIRMHFISEILIQF